MRTVIRHPTLLAFVLTHPNYDSVVSKLKRVEMSSTFEPFHNDAILQQLIEQSVSFFKVKTFFETGTYKGDSLRFVIGKFKDTVTYVSCELDKGMYDYARGELKKDPVASKCNGNVTILNTSSPEAIRASSEKGILASLTLYWLDAHWYSYWPLLDELKEILQVSKKAIIIIDDFKTPLQQNGATFDSYSDQQNDLNYINRVLQFDSHPQSYDVLFPSYFSDSSKPSQVGYAAIYMNLRDEFKEFRINNRFLLENFSYWAGDNPRIK